MGPGNSPQLVVALKPGKEDKFPDIGLIGPPGLLIVDIGQPFFLGRDIRQPLELSPGETLSPDWNQIRHFPPFPVIIMLGKGLVFHGIPWYGLDS